MSMGVAQPAGTRPRPTGRRSQFQPDIQEQANPLQLHALVHLCATHPLTCAQSVHEDATTQKHKHASVGATGLYATLPLIPHQTRRNVLALLSWCPGCSCRDISGTLATSTGPLQVSSTVVRLAKIPALERTCHARTTAVCLIAASLWHDPCADRACGSHQRSLR
jgi:hypothetical protein